MKILKNIGLLLATGLFLTACDKADEAYKKYIPNGEIIYPGKADSLVAHPGKNRIQLVWLLTTDPRVNKSRIFWNSGADSMEVAIHRSQKIDTIKAVINNLTEGSYVFQVYTYNPENARSIKSEVYGDVYGDFYESNLINRILKSATVNNGSTTLVWDEPDPRSPGVLLSFSDQSGQAKTIMVSSEEGTTVLNTIPQAGSESFQTLYLPVPSAIDTLRAPEVKVDL